MRIVDDKTINGFPLKVSISEALVDSGTDYSFEIVYNETNGGGVTLQDIIKIDIISFDNPYVIGKDRVVNVSTQKANAYQLLRRVDDTTGSIISTIELKGPLPIKHLLDNNVEVEIDLDSGVQAIGQYTLFKYLSETVGIRIPENLINGFIMEVCDLYQPTIFDMDNPFFVDREYQVSYPPTEIFNRDNTTKQPLILKVQDVVQPETDGVTITSYGGITVIATDYSTGLEYSLDSGSTYTQVTGDTITLSDLTEGVIDLWVRDDSGDLIKFQFTLTNVVNEQV